MHQVKQAAILVVDDDQSSRNLMEALLAAEGHAVRTASSGDEALATVAAQPPDMILLDIMLPGIDGFEVTRRLKAYSSTNLIPIILVTALEGRESRLVGLQAGADEFIAKPVDRTELLVRVRTLLKLREYNAALQSSKEQFRKITESAQDAIIMMGPDQRISFWNAAAARIFGYTVAEAMGQELHALITPASALAQFSQAFPHFQETGEGPIIGTVRELTALRKGGEEFPVELSISAMLVNGQWHAIGIVRDITERKQREMESQKLIAIIDSTDDAIISKTLDGIIQSWNHGAEQIFGYEPAEVIGKPMLVLIPPDRLDEEPEILSRISRGEKVDHFETVRQRKDGRLINISATISPIFDSHGKVVGISKIARDITVRKQADHELLKSRQQAQRYLDIAGVMLIALDAQGRVQMINRKGCEMLGYSEADILGKNWFDNCLPEPERKKVGEIFARLMKGDIASVEYYENEILAKSGDVLTVAWHNSPLVDESGKINGALSSGEDITARKRAEDTLRKSEKRFRATFEQAAVGIAHVAPDGHWLHVNQRLCDIVGYTREELLASTFQNITHPDDLETDLGYVHQMLAGEILTYSMEKRYFHKNGEIVWINLTVSLVRRDDGSPEYFISVVEDISERKRIEEESHLILTMGKAIAEAESFVSALTVSIRAICENTGWDFGEVWIPSHDGTHLELGAPYYCKVEDTEGFRKASKGFEFASGEGLPGRIWASGKPVWDTDVTVDTDFLRAPFAKQAGIRASVGIPIKSGDTVVAVMVFFMLKIQAEDQRMTALISAVAAQLGTAFQRKRDAEQIQRLANFDALTGLPNRILFTDRISQSLSIAHRNREQLAVMFLDLDHFKNINDTLGHLIGDALLIEVAKRLKSAVREEDTVSRLGGDEFILALPGTNVDGAARVSKKLLEIVAQPYRIKQHELSVTPSIGIAMYPDDGGNYDTLSKNADVAMYRAKHDGRNNYRFFTTEMQAHSARTLQLENALRRALERDQLRLHYQPQVSLPDGRIIGAEALLRWQHPEFGMISPAEFIPIAESSGQILQIGEWVLRTAVHQLKSWMDSGLAPMVISVNLSAVQFHQQNLPDLITHILDEAKLSPQYLELELTESVAMDDPLAAIAMMNKLHEHGIRMSIDDFGTGYSSLGYLKRFKIYKLKIDQSFVSDITEDPEDKAIVIAVISLASSLGLETIAEGVETEGQLAFLRENGCNEVQGYYFSKPLPAEQFEIFAW